jgi:hypothetical protein
MENHSVICNYFTSPVFVFRVTGVTAVLHYYICIVFAATPKGLIGCIGVLPVVQINQKCWQLLEIFLSTVRMITACLEIFLCTVRMTACLLHHPRKEELANDLQVNEFVLPYEYAV